MTPNKSTLLVTLMLCLCLVSSCRRGNERRFELMGKVVAVDLDKHQVTVSHGDIKGYMPGMTMPFTVRDQIDLREIAPNDQLSATLVVDGSTVWLEDVIVTHISDTSVPLSTAPLA